MTDEDQNAADSDGPSAPKGLNFNTITAAAFIAFSTALLVAIPYQIEKPKLFMGRSLTGMDPALFPRVAGGLLLVLSIWYLISSFRLTETNLFRELDREAITNVSFTAIVMLLFSLAMEPLGFILSSGMAIAALTIFYGNRSPVLIIASCVGVPVALKLMFTKLLMVYLPEFELFL